MLRAFLTVLRRELWLAARSKTEWLLPLLFFVIVVTLFGLGAEPNDSKLRAFAPAVLWVGALLSMLLTLERLFRADYDDGTLEQCFVSATPVGMIVAAKLASHWLLTGLPLVLLAAPLATSLGMTGAEIRILVAGLALGTPVLSLVGGFVAALVVGLPRASALLPILILPLVAPVVIFGAGAVFIAGSGLDATAPLYFLGAILALCLTLVPWVASAALHNAFE